MSTLKNPVGPQPSKVYWRRRALVLVGLVAVIVIIVLIIVRPGSSSNVGAPTTPTTSSAPPAGPAVPSEASQVETPPVADGEAAPCDAANLVVTPVTDADTYAAGVLPQISISITNTGASACGINVGTAQQVYTITSGEEQYWNSTDCQADPSDTPAVIDAGATLASTPFTWDRTRSAADTCDSAERPQVPAGGASYHLDVSIGGFASTESKQFILG